MKIKSDAIRDFYWDCIAPFYKQKTARVEIVSNDDRQAKNMRSFAVKIAETLAEEFPDIQIFGVYRTCDPWNYNHPFLMGTRHGYAIAIPKDYDLVAVKRRCIELEMESGQRIADIDVYKNPFEKISRKNLQTNS